MPPAHHTKHNYHVHKYAHTHTHIQLCMLLHGHIHTTYTHIGNCKNKSKHTRKAVGVKSSYTHTHTHTHEHTHTHTHNTHCLDRQALMNMDTTYYIQKHVLCSLSIPFPSMQHIRGLNPTSKTRCECDRKMYQCCRKPLSPSSTACVLLPRLEPPQPRPAIRRSWSSTTRSTGFMIPMTI